MAPGAQPHRTTFPNQNQMAINRFTPLFFATDGQIVEFQIRTEKMHEEAEFGVAAHWHYDEKGSVIPSKNIAWIKELAAFKISLEKLTDLENLKIDVFQNRILCSRRAACD